MPVDLRSDTVTRPSDEMREAARDASVGDDVYGDDPTVNELESRAADAVGTEDALYVPSGTMGNQIAARVHTDRGDEILVERESHVYRWELGGLAQLSDLQVRTFDAGERAVPTPEQVREGYVEESLHRPGTGLLSLENTHNARGGVAVPPEDIDAAAEAANELGVPVHLDGARLFNACVALDADPERMVREVDSVMFCLSKGLGAPVGSILAGGEEFVAAARRVRKLFGGGMRQAGIIAAPGILALDNVERLAEDHENARRLADGLDGIDGLSAPTPDTNIVQVSTEDAGVTAEEFVAACEDRGVLGGAHGEYLTRFCTNLDVSGEDIEAAIDRVRGAVEDVAV
ncbi:threonine aldolase family protein [Halopelagius longus]|uniref:Aminotransferase class I/II-fold pyridoxal phosphate-dependent enzyme n=1 Tax=Halopelagius longus TaxID=1236180 RepID=A0A1H1E6F0_9EURY|nr:GntG family PLP-dependent aldolase [Halopelagius longus]RDI71630.1 aminotransferase class I/II-fold pyridoxal phosphate-dependent enzyme [Halopelagius longus]SDQ84362.1 L-threonine aldolase [Halopelagius longus]